MLSINAHRGV
jgi:hypothetical protein